ncbi:MAG: sulfatase-like hydrolase/transferase [Akkermansiaceae bacterium]
MKTILPLLFLTATLAAAATDKPNIIVLLADDAGYADFGFQESADPALAALTPNLTRLAKEGVIFRDAYVSGAVCSPSRAGLFTGRYQQRFGFETNLPPGYMKGGLPLEEKFIGDRLKPLGYTTGLIGKWHQGYPDAYHPEKRGFDHFYGLLQGSRIYFPMKQPSPHRVFLLDGKPTPEKGYVTDRIGQGACDFIKANKEKPFFLFVSFTAPHSPLQSKPNVLKTLGSIPDEKRRQYAGLVKTLDDNCGLILKCLDDHQLAENTLVIFANDNGGQTLTGAINTPLRGRKSDVYEGGVRIPMAMRWPKQIKPGRSVETPVISLDWLPTFVEIAGGTIDESWKLDGLSLAPLLSDAAATLPPRPLYWRTKGKDGPAAIREGDWKLVIDQAGAKPALYHLSKDIAEAQDLAAEQPEKLKELTEKLATWQSGLIEPLW